MGKEAFLYDFQNAKFCMELEGLKTIILLAVEPS